MHIPLSLLLFFIGSTSTKKQGDFGIFTACLNKTSLRLDCSYAFCKKSPPFECEFLTSNGSVLANKSTTCRLTLKDHYTLYVNKTTSYNCTLTRNKRNEQRNITIDYRIRKGQHRIKRCQSTAGLLLHRAPTLLWPVVILSLWRVVGTDIQTT